MAREVPNHPALIVPSGRSGGRARYDSYSFDELEGLTNKYANGLTRAGVTRDMRTLMMVRPGVEFLSLTFALFKMGAVPVMIDPGMGVGRMLECIRSVQPEALIGIPPAHAVRVLRRKFFQGLRVKVTVGRRWFWGGSSLSALASGAGDEFVPVDTAPDDTAAILFTSGATGPAKGVVYKHRMFDAQVRMIRDHYGIKPGEVDLPTFPLFALFNPAMGTTSVIPDMNASRPGSVNPARIVEAIQDHQVTSTFGSPALWRRVCIYCQHNKVTLPTLKRVLVAGAPVPHWLIESLHEYMGPDTDVHTPYGATESLPVCSISGRELRQGLIEKTRGGGGTCVGVPLPGMEVKVLPISDEPIASMGGLEPVADGQIGEFVVSGPVVTQEYAGRPEATALAKIRDGQKIWHRMGDVGYRDADGRLWFCGRKNHRVETAAGTCFTIPCEAVFNEHVKVSRSAIVGVTDPGTGKRQPVLIIETVGGKVGGPDSRNAFVRELLQLGSSNVLTEGISKVLFYRSFPVDVRHNAKINREKLAEWASEQLR
jgi:acyl-CoA synthetase (AMP-forming)/AMP-acid ligase II